MRKFARTTLLPFLALLPFAAACAPSIGSAISAVQMARGISQGVSLYNDFYEARRTQIPIAGTYRLTYSFPDEPDRSIYVRTLSNANMPLAIDARRAPEDLGGVSIGAGYMVNILASLSAETLPDSMNQNDGLHGGGFLIVSDTLGRDAAGSPRFLASFQLRGDVNAPGDAGAIARHMESLIEEMQAAEKAAERRKDKDSPVSNQYAVLTLSSDGTVQGTQEVLRIAGAERMRVRAERISETAYVVPAENLETPSVGDLFGGYRDAIAGES